MEEQPPACTLSQYIQGGPYLYFFFQKHVQWAEKTSILEEKQTTSRKKLRESATKLGIWTIGTITHPHVHVHFLSVTYQF